jgi:hypothetical protein
MKTIGKIAGGGALLVGGWALLNLIPYLIMKNKLDNALDYGTGFEGDSYKKLKAKRDNLNIFNAIFKMFQR